ncbi:TPA: hypothetical protein EYO12_03505 [Candidatus Saccharibacteria bacterium]|nr:hypothetical protein [Candidatus Saccharibacteria bacterium]HIO87903.1 hypothetical protein [Candidatus Saccharibacteria bacterium]
MKKVLIKGVDIIHSITFWQLILTVIILLPLGLFGLRQNNLQMGELKLAVIDADEAGVGQQEALDALSKHVFTHMNTSTEVELASTYDRVVAQIQSDASQNLVNPQLFEQGQAACASRPSAVRQQCVQDYVVANSNAGADVVNLEYPEKGFYRFSFYSPRWTPDLAGWSLLGTAVSVLLMIFKVVHKKIRP